MKPLSRHHTSIVPRIALGLLLSIGCGGRKQNFIGGLAFDSCNQNWPVCDQIAGCILGTRTYIEGHFPGESRMVVQLAEASTVTVHIFLENVRAKGQETNIDFFETGCINRIRQSASGAALVAEFDQFGEFTRNANLTGIGDHLIDVTSDTETNYTLKLSIDATRLQ